MQFPIGLGLFVGLVVTSAIAGAFVSAPFLIAFTEVEFDILGRSASEVSPWTEGLILMPIGLAIFFVEVHLVNTISALHAVWARFMLGLSGEDRTDDS